MYKTVTCLYSYSERRGECAAEINENAISVYEADGENYIIIPFETFLLNLKCYVWNDELLYYILTHILIW